MALLELKNLSVTFNRFKAVANIDLSLEQGEILGIVGESGSGKSVMAMSVMGLLDDAAKIDVDHFYFNNLDMRVLSVKERRQMMGKSLSMIFQDALTSLNPCFSIGKQLIETLITHDKITKKKAFQKALTLLRDVGIPDVEHYIHRYPHELSGGMCQRVMIAIAVACQPKLVIADEPTTALDVTIQAQVIELLLQLQKKYQMGLIFITHDLALISEVADHVAVMYAGQIVEIGTTMELFTVPKHPYTQALLRALPEFGIHGQRLHALEGVVPGAYDRPFGCVFAPRCQYAVSYCQNSPAMRVIGKRKVLCHYPLTEDGVPNDDASDA